VIDADEITRWDRTCSAIVRDYYAPGLDREDLMQEARIGVFKALRDFKGERGNLGAFVSLVVRRQVVTAVKTATRGKHTPLNFAVTAIEQDGEERDALELQAAAGADPFEVLRQRADHGAVADSIRNLSRLERDALVLMLAEHSYLEIAETLGTNYKAVDNAITRARLKLRGAHPEVRAA
jgi:RNA polymerase sporulation-specific sigma factor